MCVFSQMPEFYFLTNHRGTIWKYGQSSSLLCQVFPLQNGNNEVIPPAAGPGAQRLQFLRALRILAQSVARLL